MSEGWLFRELPVDVYCTFDWEQQHLFISFLPPDYIYKLPEKGRDEFDRIYCEFASWVSDELGLYDYVDSKLDSPVSDALFDEIRGEIKRRIDAYEKTHPPLSMTFRELLLKNQKQARPVRGGLLLILRGRCVDGRPFLILHPCRRSSRGPYNF